MSETAAPAPVATQAPAPPPGETAVTPSVAGGAELGSGVKGRAAAIAKAAAVIEAQRASTNNQALKVAQDHAAKLAAKPAEPAREEDGKFKPALSPADATKQAIEDTKPKAPAAADDDETELEKLEKQWKDVRAIKKAAKAARREAAAWQEEKGRTQRELAADAELKAKNPSAWLEKHGFDFRQVAKEAVEKTEPTAAEKAAAEAKALAEKLQRELDELKAEKVTEKGQVAMARLQSEHAAAWESSSSDYPTLAQFYETQDIIDTITELRVDAFQKSKGTVEVPIATALAHMEAAAKREQARFTKAAPAAKERTERATVPAKAGKTRAVVGPVTNRDAAVNATPPSGLSPEERRARSTQLAAAGWRR